MAQTIIDIFVSIFSNISLVAQDPLKWVQELVIIFVAFIVLAYCYTYKRRVIQALTGDDRLHCNPLDFFWFCCFRCCGCCYGEWTRTFTNSGCCRGCTRCYRKNLIQEMGKFLGVYTYPIELKNIVVGDLPYDSRRGDFYLQVEVGTNPPMVTSLQEEKMPKVVHFPEILVIRVRNNLVEQRIRIVVRELNVLGHQDICDVYLSPTSVLDWMNDVDPMKRFAMKPRDHAELERETQPWICLEMSEQTEARHIETLQDRRASSARARTWVPETTFDKDYVEKVPVPAVEYSVLQNDPGHNFFGLWSTQYQEEKRNIYDQNMEDFKHSYPLMDEAGNPLNVEVDEKDLATLDCYRRCGVGIFHCCSCCVFFIVIAYIMARGYIYSCYHQYTLLTMAGLNHTPFPVSLDQLHDLNQACNERFEGTGKPMDGSDYCRPSHEQIMRHCEYGTQEPEAFQGLAHKWFDWNEFAGLPCLGKEGLCHWRDELIIQYSLDNWIPFIALVLAITLCCVRCGVNECVVKERNRLQRRSAMDRMKREHRLKDVGKIEARGGVTAGAIMQNAKHAGTLMNFFGRGH